MNDVPYDGKRQSVGCNIKRIREIKGVKQFRLAELIGVAQQTLSEFENATRLRKSTLAKIAKGLDVPVNLLENFSEDTVQFFVTDNVPTDGRRQPVGFNIKRIREIRGMKQFHLAELAGITQQTLSEFENVARLKKSTLAKIAKGLNVPVDLLENFSEDAVHLINSMPAH